MARFYDSTKVVEWRRRLARFQKVRGSIAAFCDDEGVSTASFYVWRRKLVHSKATPVGDGQQAEMRARHGDFAPVRLVGAQIIAAWLPGGTRVEIPVGDPRLVELTLQALVRADASGPSGQQANTQAGGARC